MFIKGLYAGAGISLSLYNKTEKREANTRLKPGEQRLTL